MRRRRRKVELVPCPWCDGRGQWRPGRGPAPRPFTFTIPPDGRPQPPGDSTIISLFGEWVICGGCGGFGWSSRGARFGHQHDRRLRIGRDRGRCYRCETPWPFVASHDTDYQRYGGMFPLCEPCWSELTPDERLPYYRMLFDRWNRDDPGLRGEEVWDQIEAAVRDGL